MSNAIGWRRWLTSNGHNLAPATGQDASALEAIAACWDLYARGDNTGRAKALKAAACLLDAMQEKCWPFAKALIARSVDTAEVDRVWFLAGMGCPQTSIVVSGPDRCAPLKVEPTS